MRPTRASHVTAGVLAFSLWPAIGASAQTMEQVRYFTDSITEKEELVVRLSGGSSWVLAARTAATVAADVLIVMRDVTVNGQRVRAAWLYHEGEEIPARHVEGVYPQNAAYLTRVISAEGQGETLRLADGTNFSVLKYERGRITRWVPPFKALLSSNRIYLYNLGEGKRVWVQVAQTSK